MNFSKQREAILDYLKNTKEHPTAEKIYIDLKPFLPNLSLATVYRNLNRLCMSEMIVRLTTDGKMDHYDADVSDHQHFVCKECGKVSDMFFKLPQTILDENIDDDFSVDSYKLYIYGTCGACRKKGK